MLQPPGGGSSNLFGGYEDDSAASRRPHKMESKIFAPPEQSQSVPRRSNPPGLTNLSGLTDVQRQASQSFKQCQGCENCYYNVIIPVQTLSLFSVPECKPPPDFVEYVV